VSRENLDASQNFVTFDDIADELVDKTGPSGDEFLYVDISSVDRESKKITEPKLLESSTAPSRAKQRLKVGDVLISMTRPNLNAVALITSDLDGSIGSTGFHVIRSGAVEPKFIYYLVQTRDFVEKMCEKVQGALYPAVRPRDINSYRFFLPSTAEEQRRIVAKIEALLSELDKGIESLRTAREQLKVYRQAVLKHAFEGKLTAHWREQNKDKLESPEQLLARIQQEREARYQQQLEEWKAAVKAWETGGKEGKKPGKLKSSSALKEISKKDGIDLPQLPIGWVYVRLGALIDEPTYGTSKKCAYESGDKGVLRIPNISQGAVDSSDLKFASFEQDEIRTLALEKGDLLTIRSNGSVSLVGSCALITEKDTDFLFAGYLIRLRPNRALVIPEFLLLALSSHFLRRQIESAAKSTSGVNNINTGEIQGLVVPLPSIEEQGIMLQALEASVSNISVAEHEFFFEIGKSETLRQSILKKAFSGQLIQQNFTIENTSAPRERKD